MNPLDGIDYKYIEMARESLAKDPGNIFFQPNIDPRVRDTILANEARAFARLDAKKKAVPKPKQGNGGLTTKPLTSQQIVDMAKKLAAMNAPQWQIAYDPAIMFGTNGTGPLRIFTPNKPKNRTMKWNKPTAAMPQYVTEYVTLSDSEYPTDRKAGTLIGMCKKGDYSEIMVGIMINELSYDDCVRCHGMWDAKGIEGMEVVEGIYLDRTPVLESAVYVDAKKTFEDNGFEYGDENDKKVYWESSDMMSGNYDGNVQLLIIDPKKFFKAQPFKGVSMDSVILSQDKKDLVMKAISQQENNAQIFDEWGFGQVFEKGTAISLLFYGVPGTGKTLMAQAVADKLGLKLKVLQAGEIQSSEPGQAERNIQAFFKEAEKKNMLLLFDECDSLICDRNDVGMIMAATINTLLSSLEKFTGVAIFTTNRLGKMDAAFERRLSAKVEFSFPTATERVQIWKRLIPEKAPIAKDVDFAKLAEFPIAGGNIKNAVLNAARSAAYEKRTEITEKDFEDATKHEIESMNAFAAAWQDQAQLPREIGSGSRQRMGMEMDTAKGRIQHQLETGSEQVVGELIGSDDGVGIQVGVKIPKDRDVYEETRPERVEQMQKNIFEPLIEKAKKFKEKK